MADRRLLTTCYTTIVLPCFAVAALPAIAASPPLAISSTRDSAPNIPLRMNHTLNNLEFSGASGLVPSSGTRWRYLVVHSGDTLSQLFYRAGLASASWRAVLALGGRTRALNTMRPGDELALKVSADKQLQGLRYRLGQTETLLVERDSSGALRAHLDALPQTTRRRSVHGRVVKSLSSSLARAQVPARVANQLASIFKNRNRLSRHVQPGDTFTILYRTRFSGGERVAVGPIVAASIHTDNGVHRAFRARNRDGDFGYYDSSGRSFRRFISRHPVDYTRISSPFSRSRINPVTGRREPHEGVDMAAPVGTPIHAAAAGVIKFKGWEHGYGRIVKVKDFKGYSTRYAHMHGFAENLSRGDRVKRGEIIGYVGQSGRTTGPHLHFEIRKNGTPHNPMTMDLPDGHRLAPSRLQVFQQRIQPLVAKLERAGRGRIASTDDRSGRDNACAGPRSLGAALGIEPLAAARSDSQRDPLVCARKG